MDNMVTITGTGDDNQLAQDQGDPRFYGFHGPGTRGLRITVVCQTANNQINNLSICPKPDTEDCRCPKWMR